MDVDKRTVVYDVKIADSARPHASWIVGARAYVTCEDEQLLRVISLVGGQRDLAYLSLPRRNAVAEVDLASGHVLRHIGVGIEPDGLRWATSDGDD